jgi:DNA-binding transcriptional MocR family regulator
MDESSTTAAGSAIERRLRNFVSEHPAGHRLPSTRTLVAEHAASPITVQRVVRRLVAEGHVETRPGAGNFVARPRVRAQADFGWQTTALGEARTDANAISSVLTDSSADRIAMGSGYPTDDLLPVRLVRAALLRAVRSADALGRPPVAGIRDLRTWFAGELAPVGSAASAPASVDDVLITPGGQSALSSVFRALAVPGDAIVMESPTYWGAIAAARQAGLRVIPIARGARAPSAAELDDAFGSSGARLFYAQPHFANPTGTLWTREERAAILEVVRARGVYLIEDDWAHDFGIDAPVVTLASEDTDGHVVYIRSLTKSVAPTLRVAAVIARGPALARIQVDRTVDDLYVSTVLQAASLDVVTDGGWRTHLVRLRAELAARRDELARNVVAEFGPGALTMLPRGGINLWVRLADGVDVTRLARRSRDAGVVIARGGDWFPAEATGSFIRLNYTGARLEQFAGAVATVARLARD